VAVKGVNANAIYRLLALTEHIIIESH
jgi:hypothetical protein